MFQYDEQKMGDLLKDICIIGNLSNRAKLLHHNIKKINFTWIIELSVKIKAWENIDNKVSKNIGKYFTQRVKEAFLRKTET